MELTIQITNKTSIIFILDLERYTNAQMAWTWTIESLPVQLSLNTIFYRGDGKYLIIMCAHGKPVFIIIGYYLRKMKKNYYR